VSPSIKTRSSQSPGHDSSAQRALLSERRRVHRVPTSLADLRECVSIAVLSGEYPKIVGIARDQGVTTAQRPHDSRRLRRRRSRYVDRGVPGIGPAEGPASRRARSSSRGDATTDVAAIRVNSAWHKQGDPRLLRGVTWMWKTARLTKRPDQPPKEMTYGKPDRSQFELAGSRYRARSAGRCPRHRARRRNNGSRRH
jgi:hypothetical protein